MLLEGTCGDGGEGDLVMQPLMAKPSQQCHRVSPLPFAKHWILKE